MFQKVCLVRINGNYSETFSFSLMALSVWNSLPATLKSVATLSRFKSHLRTFLFAQAFQYNLVPFWKRWRVCEWLVREGGGGGRGRGEGEGGRSESMRHAGERTRVVVVVVESSDKLLIVMHI